MSNLLVVCYTVDDVDMISSYRNFSYENIIVASDDFRVHKKCKEYGFVKKAIFLQQTITYEKVSNDVIEIIEKTNCFYENALGKNIFLGLSDVAKIPSYVEGGVYNQRIQDALLYIESLIKICYEHNISCIAVSDNKDDFLTKIIFQYCHSHNIKYEPYNSKRINEKNIKYRVTPIKNLLRSVFIKLTQVFNQKKNKKNVALVWLVHSSQKHIDNSVFYNDLLEKSGFDCVWFSWGISKKIEEKTNIEKIEKYLSWWTIIKSVYLNIVLTIHTKSLKRKYKKIKINYKDVDVGDVISEVVIDYVKHESIDVYRFYYSFKCFCKYMDLKLVCGSLNNNKYGLMMEKVHSFYEAKKYLISVFSMPKSRYIYNCRKKYDDIYWSKTKIFLQNEREMCILQEETNLPKEKMYIYGSLRGGECRDEKAILINNSSTDFTIIYDFSKQIFGYFSLGEIIDSLKVVIELAKRNRRVCVLIKPHPSADTNILNLMLQDINLVNIKVCSVFENIDNLMAISDVLITKNSTIGINAMKYRTLVVSYQFDNCEDFRIFGNDGCYVSDEFELEALLNKVVSDDAYRKNLLLAQYEFYKTNFSKNADRKIIVKNLEN